MAGSQRDAFIVKRPPMTTRVLPPVLRSEPSLRLSDQDVQRIAIVTAAEVRLDLMSLRQALQPWYVKLWLWMQGWCCG